MVKTVFDFSDYRKFIHDLLSKQKAGGYGQLARISKALSINPSIVTQVLKGKKDFTLEQANDLAEFLGLTDLESEYFLCLVQIERAGKKNLRDRWERRRRELIEKSESLKARMPARKELDEASKAVFYSQWYFSGVRILTSVPGFDSVEKVAERLGLPRSTVKRVMDFLLATELCVEEAGALRMGPQSTHLEAASPLVARHHINWRQKAIEKMHHLERDELCFTSPLSLSVGDFEKVRKLLMAAVEDTFAIVDPSPSERTAFLNIDWMRY